MSLWILIALVIIGLIAIILEFFVPAAGIIGGSGIVCLIASTILAYIHIGIKVGTAFLVVVLIGTPATILVALKIFPNTFVGKRLILKSSQKQEEGYVAYTREKYNDLLGEEGITLTKLRPSGVVKINDRKYSVVTSGELIDKDEKIKVIKVEGSRIVVRKSAAIKVLKNIHKPS